MNVLKKVKKIQGLLEWVDMEPPGLGGETIRCTQCHIQMAYHRGMDFEHKKNCPVVLINKLVKKLEKQ